MAFWQTRATFIFLSAAVIFSLLMVVKPAGLGKKCIIKKAKAEGKKPVESTPRGDCDDSSMRCCAWKDEKKTECTCVETYTYCDYTPADDTYEVFPYKTCKAT